jgi:hypothetical protein
MPSSAICRGRAAPPRPPGLQTNGDGPVDVYFGPKAPPGKETNWVPTSASGKFEVLFRFYGPEKALFDKTCLPSTRLMMKDGCHKPSLPQGVRLCSTASACAPGIRC